MSQLNAEQSGSLTHLRELATGLLQIQIVQYGLAGIASAIVDLAGFAVLATFILPCVNEGMGDATRSLRFAIDKSLAFAIANMFSYYISVRWVFVPGRHSRSKEMFLFLGISTISYLFGMQLGRGLINHFGTSTALAAIACITASTVINFFARKLLVFRR
ncbi:GtrA family protein [Stieleria marina]|uniref:GtrA-like protein n=1 Tax=Stieleria marina TaxID=1930275 RepID=A0A517NNJ3_9BACT|nr:GtrA-like protein [Planctomycetes bacterium K23_9]